MVHLHCQSNCLLAHTILRMVHATSQGQILGRGLSRAHILVERALRLVHDTSISPLIASLSRSHVPKRNPCQSLPRRTHSMVALASLFHQRDLPGMFNMAAVAQVMTTVEIRFLRHCSHQTRPWGLICTSLTTSKQCEGARSKALLRSNWSTTWAS